MDLHDVSGLDAVMAEGKAETLRPLRRALAERTGPIVPLVTNSDDVCGLVSERAICIDTTAAGGNASLLAASG